MIMKHIRKFNESNSGLTEREKELMLIPINGCFNKYPKCKREVEKYLSSKIEDFEYSSKDEITEYLSDLNDSDLEILFLELFEKG